jgi:hypothetical protein
VILKIVPKAGYECTQEKNRPMRANESRNRNLMPLSEQIFELVSAFKEASKNFILIFVLNLAGFKFKNH